MNLKNINIKQKDKDKKEKDRNKKDNMNILLVIVGTESHMTTKTIMKWKMILKCGLHQ